MVDISRAANSPTVWHEKMMPSALLEKVFQQIVFCDSVFVIRDFHIRAENNMLQREREREGESMTDMLGVPEKELKQLLRRVTRAALINSFNIWCSRNRKLQTNPLPPFPPITCMLLTIIYTCGSKVLCSDFVCHLGKSFTLVYHPRLIRDVVHALQ